MKLHAVCQALDIDVEGITKLEIKFRASAPTTVVVYRILPGRLGGEMHINTQMFLSKTSVCDQVWDIVSKVVGLDRDAPVRNTTIVIDNESVNGFIDMDGNCWNLGRVIEAIQIQRKGEFGG